MREKLYRKLYRWSLRKWQDARMDREIKADPYVAITDHAILRYLERFKGLDLKAIRAEILGEYLQKRVGKLGDGKYPSKDKSVVVKNKTVITVLPMKKSRREWSSL